MGKTPRLADLAAQLPDEPESEDGFHPSQDFTVRCGRCDRSVCSFNVDIYDDDGGPHMSEPFLGRDWDHPDPRHAGMTGRGRSLALSIDRGLAFKATNALESEGRQNCWILKCPGRRCRMQQKVSWETLDRAVARAFLSGQHELVLGVDFSRDR